MMMMTLDLTQVDCSALSGAPDLVYAVIDGQLLEYTDISVRCGQRAAVNCALVFAVKNDRFGVDFDESYFRGKRQRQNTTQSAKIQVTTLYLS